MLRFLFAVIFSLSIVSQLFAVDRGSIGISVETFSFMDLFNSSQYSSGMENSSAPPLASIGLRVSPNDIIDFDFTYGISTLSEVKEDMETNTYAEPSSMSQIFSAGVVVNAVSGEKSILGIYGRFTGIVSKITYEENSSFSDQEYFEYTDFISKFGLGVEPSYYFSKNFSMYFRTGVAVSLFPASKYRERDSSEESGYVVRNRRDAATSFGTDGVTLGFRFLFGE